ncbi:thiamine-phosphate kinase [Paenibacillus radicis (ex Xue et al. 2023)]|uniref:Thiamine-monophosphate kinase n=1 Tax=Paenibacillus radicis (ex Xue et al. 2023) TaxID=2972489 RepID=A0ABT1YUC0_9BACL|nr:thiamine-phosphate kinase [Paenibacillus radicis (ex Xue et al. 2023)]MCR8636687.1 thiamine-phosphate kinase [Paenibacillus radicis (ex Xue et al. 2023)]
MSSIDEFALIQWLTDGKQSRSFQQAGGVETGIGDDAAVANITPGYQLVMTCDTMTETIHFKNTTMRDQDIGYKAMASAISDIAAMGALPKYALVAVSCPQGTELARLEELYLGLYDCANQWNVVIAGGDTTSSMGGITITVTVIGEVEKGKALLRSTAEPGDVLFVTGMLGCSAAGLDYLLKRDLPADQWPDQAQSQPELDRLVQAHCRPNPRIEAGRLLQESGVCHALNDVSDGLASEAWEISEASGVGIDLIEDKIPIADELMVYSMDAEEDPLDYILFGGEDYQLLGTMPAEHAISMQMKFREAGLALYIIGYVNEEADGVRLVQSSGYVVPIDKKGYNHFRKG